jgi:hypothetical protein
MNAANHLSHTDVGCLLWCKVQYHQGVTRNPHRDVGQPTLKMHRKRGVNAPSRSNHRFRSPSFMDGGGTTCPRMEGATENHQQRLLGEQVKPHYLDTDPGGSLSIPMQIQ